MDFSLESVLPFKATKSTELASPVFINCKLPTLNAVSLSKWILKECSPLSNKIFAISESVLKPDFYETSFIITENKVEFSDKLINTINIEEESNYSIWIILILIIAVTAIYLKIKYQRNP